ncbi:hypothetical protein SUGI_1119620 [Cryptomeria japonica]|nr:hypothetical protein SUGI_1119620 [Cryptomeria japonica]
MVRLAEETWKLNKLSDTTSIKSVITIDFPILTAEMTIKDDGKIPNNSADEDEDEDTDGEGEPSYIYRNHIMNSSNYG